MYVYIYIYIYVCVTNEEEYMLKLKYIQCSILFYSSWHSTYIGKIMSRHLVHTGYCLRVIFNMEDTVSH